MNTIRETEAKITKLPRAPSNDPVSEVLQTLNMFSRELSRRLGGTPEKGGLLQTIRLHQEVFRCAICGTAPAFVPWEKEKAGKKLPKAKFLRYEEGDEEEEEEEVENKKVEVEVEDDDDDEEEEENSDALDGEPDNWGWNPKSNPKKTAHADQNIYIDEVLKRAQRCVLLAY